MKLIALLALAAAGYVAYRRYAEEKGGYEATESAQPFSSESLRDDPAPPSPAAAPVESAPPATPGKEPGENTKDTLERPTWLDPADAAKPADGDAA